MYRNLISKMTDFLSSISKTDWMTFITSLMGAVIGAGAALYVHYHEIEQQKQRDKDQQNSTEQNKLKYLDFLMKDSNKIIISYVNNSKRIVTSYNNNPFVIPDYITYPAHSLNTIANKINQEDYYLSSVNQIHNNDDIAEIFPIYNTLYQQHKEAVDHYSSEVKNLIDNKNKYRKSLYSLIENINQLMIENQIKKMSNDDKIINSKLYTLIDSLNVILTQKDPNIWLRDSPNLLINPVISILDPLGEVSHRKLLLQAYQVREDYEMTTSHMRNVVEDTDRHRILMEQLVERINKISQPLREYINNIKNANH